MSAVWSLSGAKRTSTTSPPPSALFIERRLAALVGHLETGVGYLGAHLEHDLLDAAPDRKITTRRTPRRQARQVRQHGASDLVDQGIGIVPADKFAPLLHQPQLQHLSLGCEVRGVGLRAWRLLPLAPQVSQVSNAALIERVAVTLPLDHAFGFELANVGPAANQGAVLTPTP